MKRSSFVRALIKLNFDLMANNAISKSTFLFLMMLQSCVILCYPFFVFCYNEPVYKSLILAFYQMNPPYSMIIFLAFLLIFQSVVLLEYLSLLIFEWVATRKRDVSRKSSDDDKEVLPSHYKFFLNLIIFQYLVIVLILNIPSRSFATRSVIQAATDLKLDKDEARNLEILSILLLIVDFINTMIFHSFLQNVFPLQYNIPWAQLAPQFQLLQELVYYMYSVAISLPQAADYTYYIYAIFTVLTLLSIIYSKTYYDLMVLKFSNFNQSFIIMSMLILSCGLSRSVKFRSFYLIMIVLLAFIIMSLIQLVDQQRRINVFLYNDKLSKSKDAMKWVWTMHTNYEFDSETKQDKLIKIMIQLQNQIKRHQMNCRDNDCICARKKVRKLLKIKQASLCTADVCQRLKLQLIEIYLQRIFSKTDSELQSNSKNDILGLFLVHLWQKTQKNYLCCIYNLLKYHDCKSCTIHECSQFYFLTRIIHHKLMEKQLNDESAVKFQKMIYFEQSFKGYTNSINSTIQTVNEFWQNINKNTLEIEKSDKLSDKIIKNYHRYVSIYSRIIKECGEIAIVERLAWRFNQEIMQFEQEALQNIDNLKIIINKQRLHKRSIEEDLLQFNFKNFFIIISANPQNFQSILGVSKQLTQFVGYTEEFLLTNKLPVLLPKIIDTYHDRLLKNYLRRKNTSLQNFLLKQQWLQKSDGTVVPVTINIIPKYDVNEGLRLVGIIHAQKQFSLFEKELNCQTVFAFLADINQKLIHVSENCIQILKLMQSIHKQDIQMHSILKNIPDNLENKSEFMTDISILHLVQNINEVEFLQDRRVQGKVFYQERTFGEYNTIREYLVIFMVQQDMTVLNANRYLTMYDSNVDIHTLEFSQMNIQGQSSATQLHQSDNLQATFSDSQIQNFMDLSSMSSNSSGSSNFSTQDAQIGEIKQIFDFNLLPKSLKIYRIKIILGFLLILATTITLLVVNSYSKQEFQQDLNALFSEKRIRNNFSSSKLISLLIFSTSNMPSQINVKDFGIQQINKNISLYYLNNMPDVLEVLQKSLNDFSIQQTQWDPDFVKKFNNEQLNMTFLTTTGNIMHNNMTLYKALTLLQDYTSQLGNYEISDFIASFNIYETNTVQEIQKAMKIEDISMRTILSYLFYLVENGSNIMLTQIKSIDQQFIQSVLKHGDSIIEMLLIFTLVCCGIILIQTTFYIPFLFGVEEIQKQMLQFTYKTDKVKVSEIIKNCKELSDYIESNKFLQEEEGSKQNNRTTNNIQVISQIELTQQTFPAFNVIEENKESNTSNQANSQQIQFPSHQTFNKQTYQTNDRFESNEDLVLNNNKLKFNKKPSQAIKTPQLDPLQKFQGDNLKFQLDLKKSYKSQQITFNKSKFARSEKEEIKEEKSSNDDTSNDGKSENKGHKKQRLKRKNTENQTKGALTEGSKSQAHTVDYQMMNKQAQKRKFKIGAILYIIASLIIAFYVSVFFMSRNILSSYQRAFYQYDAFYIRNTCQTQIYFLLQKSILYNESMREDSFSGKILDSIYEECNNNENKFRNIKKDTSGIFSSILDSLALMDSSEYCKFMIDNGGANDDCYTDAQGFLLVGLQQIIASSLNHINQMRINYNAKPQSERTVKYLTDTFYNPTTFRNIGIYYAYLEWTFRNVQIHIKAQNKTIEDKTDFQAYSFLGDIQEQRYA
ncbi:UNKNOWN [Stylonychia lemnae]|uniref:Pas domain s-box family protein n=1 Tax=Stylonychia lemnae TaxID=5949 RepID=A0A078BAR9_STYLE|nr:UNKNOWN [Stylonychia lemnae]|eukprot:CDW91454.1 UNKNOWN [Stylonychia lemnae]